MMGYEICGLGYQWMNVTQPYFVMKLKHILLPLLFVLFAAVPQMSHAQIIDSLPPFFKAEPHFVGDFEGIRKGPLDFAMPGGTTMVFVHISALKKMAIPTSLSKSIKTADGPIVLRKNGKCYQFACEGRACKLFWWDRNGDGKVQPKRELRCGDKGRESCGIRVKEVPCR